MSTRIVSNVVAPQVVSSAVTLQLNTQVGPFQAGSTLVVSPQYASNLVNGAPECVALSTNIQPGAYVIVRASSGCYGPYY